MNETPQRVVGLPELTPLRQPRHAGPYENPANRRPIPFVESGRGAARHERTPLTQFTDLGLAAPIMKALAQEGYVTPTPIQAEAIPHILANRDLIGIAQTGTGKTAAFALPILTKLAQQPRQPFRNACRVLVLSPTRELSGQILDSFNAYGRELRLHTALAIGGLPIGRQARAVAPGVDILVATPGRLKDLVDNCRFRLDQVEMFVLDEADRMLDMGFIHAIREICGKLPKDRHSLLFSATMPPAIAALAAQFLRDPVTVAVTPQAATADLIAQRVIMLDRGAKPQALTELLNDPTVTRALVFTRTKHGADRVVRGLEKDGIAVDAIHGNKSQGQREKALGAFRRGRVRVLVATDIAARGIDVDGISHVINFDLPNIAESYVHRIGRTARAGATGIAISFCSDADDRSYLRDIEKLIRQQIPTTDRAGAAVHRPAAAAKPFERPRGDGKPRPPAHNKPYKHANANNQPRRPAPHRGQAEGRSNDGEIGGLNFLKPSPVRSAGNFGPRTQRAR